MSIGRLCSAHMGVCEPVIQTDAGTFPAPRTVGCEHVLQRRLFGRSRRASQQPGRRCVDGGVLSERCAGLDVGKDEVVACIRVPAGAGGRRQQVRTFGTFSSGLEALADWLTEQAVTHVVMKATGQYWKSCW